jgi:hypothetical protein
MLLIWIGASIPGQAAELVGSIVPPYPDGTWEESGACIGGAEQSASCDRNVAVLANANRKLGIFSGALRRGADGGTRWLVLDYIPYPRVPKGSDLAFAVCRNNGGETDPSVIAVVRESRKEWLQATDWAYRIERESGKFVRVDPRNVVCINTALGAV